MKMLIVEDDPTLLRGLTDAFRDAGFELQVTGDGDSAVDVAIEDRPDIVLLDLMLPGLNGFEVCQILRDAYPELPILIVSARAEESDIIRGLELGADDYIIKPFSIAELRARVNSALRRTTSNHKGVRHFGPFQLDLDARTLHHKTDGLVELTVQEFATLAYFINHEGRAITREMLLNSAWERPPSGRTRTVDRCIAKLRAKIENDAGRPKFLRTIHGVGYRFESGS